LRSSDRIALNCSTTRRVVEPSFGVVQSILPLSYVKQRDGRDVVEVECVDDVVDGSGSGTVNGCGWIDSSLIRVVCVWS